ncbi:MAG: hypothetical protein K9M81_05275 [Chthoniobacterales bacterium]|nr:hypothetical protein [Chthoniobacterales bacterium]
MLSCHHFVVACNEDQRGAYSSIPIITSTQAQELAPYKVTLTLSNFVFFEQKQDILLQKGQELIILINNLDHQWHLPSDQYDEAALFLEYSSASDSLFQELSLEAENDLAPLFYIDREKEATKSDENGKVSLSSQGCMSTCFLSQNTSPTKHSSDISASIDDRYELSVLDANPLVYHLRAGRSCSTVNLKFYSKYYPVGNVRGIIALHKRDFNPLLHITIK